MKGLNRRENKLFIDEVSLEDIAKEYGTPVYVYSGSKLKENLKGYLSSIREKDKICYSVKSNSNIHLLELLADLGSGFDVVSGNELRKCLEAGAKPEDIVFSGVGKTEEELVLAIKENIFSINIESEEELDRIIKTAKDLEKKAQCMIRINPDISSESHPYIQTGLKTSKFGILREGIDSIVEKASKSRLINLKGIASHVGSQIFNKELIFENLNLLIEIANNLIRQGHALSYIDLGGGLGISYQEERELKPREVLEEVISRLEPLNLNLLLEPGRSISGNTGVLLSKVEYLKKTSDLNFAVIDSGMNDLLRPSLYQAWHNISVVATNNQKELSYTVVGPVCESGDTFGEDRILSLDEDSILAIHDAGAYGHVMSSNYNSRLRPPEILVEGQEIKVIRRRETFDDLLRQERDV
ncbi:MAG TPA: diaminopimelate decarboxylase [Gammaproteobacteria bacterium]|nr:diaminopimelate decarboxylase [Gammaproteobacteria bacterium]HIO43772.1 diaminopimelate decarboxylase [Gammaproteobacteria bacterium]